MWPSLWAPEVVNCSESRGCEGNPHNGGEAAETAPLSVGCITEVCEPARRCTCGRDCDGSLNEEWEGNYRHQGDNPPDDLRGHEALVDPGSTGESLVPERADETTRSKTQRPQYNDCPGSE